MVQVSFPFSNKPVSEADWTKMAQHWLKTGVVKSMLNELQVYADSTGMQVKVKPGVSWVKGHYHELTDNDEVLAIGSANATNPRIDRVILRNDWSNKNIQVAVLQGVPAVSPVAPSLTQNSARWEISLAQVRVNANVSTIAAGDITDERTYANEDIRYTKVNGTIVNGATGAIVMEKMMFVNQKLSLIHLYTELTNIPTGGIKGNIPLEYAPNGAKTETGILGVRDNSGAVSRNIQVNGDGTVGVMGSADGTLIYKGSVTYFREET